MHAFDGVGRKKLFPCLDTYSRGDVLNDVEFVVEFQCVGDFSIFHCFDEWR